MSSRAKSPHTGDGARGRRGLRALLMLSAVACSVGGVTQALAAGSPWQRELRSSAELGYGSCDSAGDLCAVGVYAKGELLTSTDPTRGASAWHTSTIGEHPLRGLACPSATLCVATDS
jgi:hypothetical protein